MDDYYGFDQGADRMAGDRPFDVPFLLEVEHQQIGSLPSLHIVMAAVSITLRPSLMSWVCAEPFVADHVRGSATGSSE